jgi:hypothetical protein
MLGLNAFTNDYVKKVIPAIGIRRSDRATRQAFEKWTTSCANTMLRAHHHAQGKIPTYRATDESTSNVEYSISRLRRATRLPLIDSLVAGQALTRRWSSSSPDAREGGKAWRFRRGYADPVARCALPSFDRTKIFVQSGRLSPSEPRPGYRP